MSKSVHEKLTKTSSLSLEEAKRYLERCSQGKYPASYYHYRKCQIILGAFNDWLYNSFFEYNGQKFNYHNCASSMIECYYNLKTKKK